MKPYMVIPAAKVKKKLASIPGFVVAATQNGWMNENLTSDWVEKVWTNFSFAKCMLVCSGTTRNYQRGMEVKKTFFRHSIFAKLKIPFFCSPL